MTALQRDGARPRQGPTDGDVSGWPGPGSRRARSAEGLDSCPARPPPPPPRWRPGAGSPAPEGSRAAGPSATFEGGLAGALLDERVHPDAPVLGREKCGELLPLDLQTGVEVGLETTVDRVLGGAQRVRRT